MRSAVQSGSQGNTHDTVTHSPLIAGCCGLHRLLAYAPLLGAAPSGCPKSWAAHSGYTRLSGSLYGLASQEVHQTAEGAALNALTRDAPATAARQRLSTACEARSSHWTHKHMSSDPLLTTAEAAAYLGLAAATLESWRCRPPRDGAPPFCRLGRAIRYRQSSLDKWLASQEFLSTAAADARSFKFSR